MVARNGISSLKFPSFKVRKIIKNEPAADTWKKRRMLLGFNRRKIILYVLESVQEILTWKEKV